MTTLGNVWCVEWHAALPSTMTRAGELAVAGEPTGMVVVADYQTEGRGTRGRVWHAAPGTCLMFTVLARPPLAPAELPTLPGAVSRSIAAVLADEFELECEIKEPNDLLVNGRKLCGVLCTSHIVGNTVTWVLCGVGLNTSMDAVQLPLPTATSLLTEGVKLPSHTVLLERLLDRLTWLRKA